jgi:hypothetical protein
MLGATDRQQRSPDFLQTQYKNQGQPESGDNGNGGGGGGERIP